MNRLVIWLKYNIRFKIELLNEYSCFLCFLVNCGEGLLKLIIKRTAEGKSQRRRKPRFELIRQVIKKHQGCVSYIVQIKRKADDRE